MFLRSRLTLFLIFFSSVSYSTSYAAKTEYPRIISQSPYISEMLDYMDMGQCIVGVSRYSKRDLPRTGGILDPDAGAIDSLMPDLIITSDWTKKEVLKKVTPEAAKTLRLTSFNSMEHA